MNSTLNKIIMFTAGALVGSAVTWKIVKTKYEQLIDEEIESVKESYGRLYKKNDEADEKESESKTEVNSTKKTLEKDRTEYESIVSTAGYKVNNEEYGKKEEKNDMDRPYVIPPEEFKETGYEERYLTLYTDGVLEDDFGDVINPDDIDDLVGVANLERIGEYEDDLLHVRNEYEECDFEISKDYRSFSEIS